jgi:2-oxoglutarate ferredoxin oxidoreductase subunit beta
VEVLGSCVERGKKLNENLKLKELARQAGLTFGEWQGETRPAFRLSEEHKTSMLDTVKEVGVDFSSPLVGRQAIVLGGSAGEGVQKAAELFAHAALACSLYVTKKGSYPVTVGVGFSTAEIILSRDPIDYHGISQPDVVIVTSQSGLDHNRKRIRDMGKGSIWADATVWQEAQLNLSAPGVEVHMQNFRERAGSKNTAIYALLTFIKETGILPIESLLKMVNQDSIRKFIPSELLLAFT